MKIAFDTFNLGISLGSGNKTYTVEIIKALGALQTGDKWQLITFWRREKTCRAIFGPASGCTIQGMLPHSKLLGNHLKWFIKMLYPAFEAKIGRQCDLFHCTNPVNFPVAMPKVVTTIHDLVALREEPWVPDNAKIDFRKNIGRIINRSALIFAVSEFTRSEIISRFPAAEGKIMVTPNAAHPRFRPVGSDRSFLSHYGIREPSSPYLLSVGEIMERKNTLATIKAFESVAQRFPGLALVLIGQARKNEYTDEVFKHLAGSPLRDRIKILHTVTDDDLVLFYNHAVGMVYFSFFEGFGLPIIEAMASGCPVAASCTSSMKEIAGNAAIMVDPYDVESMRSGMLQLLDNGPLRTELKDKGFERAAQYSWKKTAELTYEGYKKALGRLAPRHG
jgi:O-antigen biosynthesis alpha-1,3-mannosyltransferase